MIFGRLNQYSLNFKLNISILACVCCGFFALVYFVSKSVAPIMISQIDALALKSVTEYAKDISHLAADTEQIINNTKNTLSQTNENDTNSLYMMLNSALKTTIHSDLQFTQAWVYVFADDDVSKGKLYFPIIILSIISLLFSPLKAGSPIINSYNIAPKDQISDSLVKFKF